MFKIFTNLCCIFMIGCVGPRVFIPGLPPPLIMLPFPQPRSLETLDFYVVMSTDTIHDMIDTSSILRSGWTGLQVWDLDADTSIMERYSDKMFTPASNVKLLTTYACLITLGDSIPGLKYIESDTSIVFWGTGDPSFLNDKFKATRTYDFLKQKALTKRLYYWPQRVDAPFGEGWMWDDYNGGYQPEVSALPLYENMVHFAFDKKMGWSQKPSIGTIIRKPSRDYNIQRSVHANDFEISSSIDSLEYYQQNVPIYNVNDQTIKLLSDTLDVPVQRYDSFPNRKIAKTLYSFPTDTIVSEMMANSDNFLAEQLLMVCGNVIGDTLSTKWTIDTLLSGKMSHFTPQPKWVDGSGLSRYNLSAPSQNIQLLRDIYFHFGERRVFNLMAAGGRRGTIKSLYTDQATPYVYAKTGTLGSIYNLSGYIITHSGRRLAFSMMNNHFSSPTSKARLETQKVIKLISQW